jgi:DNA repair protein RadC
MSTNVVKIYEKRELLKNLSVQARELRTKRVHAAKTEKQRLFWERLKVNDILKIMYKESVGATELKTFEKWEQSGYRVKRGAKGFLVWGDKRAAKKTYLSGNEEKEETYFYYSVAFLFSNNQVEQINIVQEEKEAYSSIAEISVSYKNKPSEMKKVLCSRDAFQIFKPIYFDCMEHHEEMYALYMNHGNKCLGVSKISQGGTAGTVCDVKIILQTALKVNASCIMLSHNHPSGNLQPSRTDNAITMKLKDASKLLDIQLLDHLIITDDSYYSYADEGRI